MSNPTVPIGNPKARVIQYYRSTNDRTRPFEVWAQNRFGYWRQIGKSKRTESGARRLAWWFNLVFEHRGVKVEYTDPWG